MSKFDIDQNEEEAPVKLNIDLNAAETVVCSKCGNATFAQVVLMKRLSALISPTQKEAFVPMPVFACNACGNVNDEFLPKKKNLEI